MKTTSEMIKETDIWAGLNKPGIPEKEADVVVFGVPYDGAVSFRTGAKDAPAAIRGITYTIDPTTERFESFAGMKVLDLGDCEGSAAEEVFKNAEDAAYNAVKNAKLFTMIGGDHSSTIPVLRGINRAVKDSFGIIHFDSHFDLCDDMDENPLSHGCTERRALELSNINGLDSIFFVGLRSIESQELEYIKGKRLNILSAREIRQLGTNSTAEIIKSRMSRFKSIYVTIDIDCLDPAYAPGTGTPQFGGIDAREMLDLLYEVFKLPVIGFDVVEVAPNLDDSGIALFAARKIITECWGHHYRKGMNFRGRY